MTTFINSFQSERLKRKRNLAAWLVVVGAFFTPSIILLVRIKIARRYRPRTAPTISGTDSEVDLIFLDINLGEFSGIQLLETPAVSSQVILTIAYQEYALKGFDLKVTDYLLKPFTFERFVQAVARVRSNLPGRQIVGPKNFIFVKTENRLEKISLREIIYIEGMRDYRKIHTAEKRVMTLQTFTEFERQIPTDVLCRVHKSYMVALDKIDSIEKDRIKIKGRVIPVSETYKQMLFALINHPPKR